MVKCFLIGPSVQEEMAPQCTLSRKSMEKIILVRYHGNKGTDFEFLSFLCPCFRHTLHLSFLSAALYKCNPFVGDMYVFFFMDHFRLLWKQIVLYRFSTNLYQGELSRHRFSRLSDFQVELKVPKSPNLIFFRFSMHWRERF